MDNVDAVFLRKRLIAMREGFQRAEPSEIEVAEEAGGVPRFGLDQCHIERLRAQGQVLGGRRTAHAAADHNNPCLGLTSRGPWRERPYAHRSGQATKLSTCPRCHRRWVSFPRAAK